MKKLFGVLALSLFLSGSAYAETVLLKCEYEDGKLQRYKNNKPQKVEKDNAIKEIEITPDSPIVVDNGHLVAYTEGVNYTVDKSGGWKTTMIGGEGLILRFSGTGKIWIQSRNLESLASTLIPFMGSN